MKSILSTLAILGFVSSATIADAADAKGKTVEVAVTKKGFEPKSIEVKAGTPLTLKVTRKTDATCAKAITVAGTDLRKDLPLDEVVTIEVGTLRQGEVKFGCGMGKMVGGMIFVK